MGWFTIMLVLDRQAQDLAAAAAAAPCHSGFKRPALERTHVCDKAFVRHPAAGESPARHGSGRIVQRPT